MISRKRLARCFSSREQLKAQLDAIAELSASPDDLQRDTLLTLAVRAASLYRSVCREFDTRNRDNAAVIHHLAARINASDSERR
jgi:hypothetical protein